MAMTERIEGSERSLTNSANAPRTPAIMKPTERPISLRGQIGSKRSLGGVDHLNTREGQGLSDLFLT